MIIVKLWGGLGNQMFQYAAAAALAKECGGQLALDLHHFGQAHTNETPRQYALSVFPNIQDPGATSGEIKKVFSFFRGGVLYKINKKIGQQLFNFNRAYLIEKGDGYTKLTVPSSGAAYLDGYWQSEKYFADHAGFICNQFNLQLYAGDAAVAGYLPLAHSPASVSLHVRRGDYVSGNGAAVHGVAALDYYTKAMDTMVSRLGEKDILFLVFSDDLAWCRQHLQIPYRHVFVETPQDHYDLFLMSNCRHNITANSSFSWWGAWLNEHPGKIVIAPKKWFVRKEKKDMIPLSWITI